MLSRLGIGARLFIAFLGITALSLSSGVAGWWILREISSAQTRINNVALPAIAAAQHTVEASGRLVVAGQALAAARDEAALARQETELQPLVADIKRIFANGALSSLDGPSLQRLSKSIDALFANLAEQNRLVKERLGLETSFSSRADRTLAASTAMVDLSETLVSNASSGASAVVSGLYGLIDEPARHQEAYDAFDRLIEQDIFLLDRMWELRLRSSQIGLLINRLTRAINEAEVADIAQQFERHLRVVRRRVESIDDPVRRKQALTFLAALESASGTMPLTSSMFGERLKLLSINDGLELVAARNRKLSTELSGVAQDFLGGAQRFAMATSAQADRAVNSGFYYVLLTSLVAVLISGLIVWLYVERGVVRRISELARAMKRLTDGDLAVQVMQGGTHELKSLAEAVVAFRDESRQRRALEVERERTNEELRRHREELRELVNERTAQLMHEVESHAEARQRAERASRAKSDFLATMSHEIRTPMTGMLGMLQILLEGKLTLEQRRRLCTAASSGEALLGILNSILDYSKIESGKVTVAAEPFRLRDCLQSVVDLMQPAATAKGLAMSLDIDDAIAPWHLGDAGKVRQIVFNLVSNAIKFTASGLIGVEARLTRSSEVRQCLYIKVTDTGIGIAGSELDIIFRAFRQSDASITRHYGGTGLGLSISKGLVEAMGGALTVRSEAGSGSAFTLSIELPVAEQPQVLAELQGAQHDAARPLHILVVEDDEATRAVAAHFIAGLGHEVMTAADGYRAVDIAVESPPDLVLMDISLPGMDGISAARELRKRLPHLPIIAMSAHVFREEVDHYLKSGMDAYVAKPLAPETLAGGIATAVAAKESGTQLSTVNRKVITDDLALLGPVEMARILDIVENTLPARLTMISSACAAGDWIAAAREGHAAFSAASAAGFTELAKALARLEALAKEQNESGACRVASAFAALYAESMKEARRIIARQA